MAENFVPKLPTPPAGAKSPPRVQYCEFEPGCENRARKLVGARLHPGPDGLARAWVCDEHFSKLAVASPFSSMSVLTVLPE